MRADLEAGEITWGELFTIQPFGNSLVQMELTGAQLIDLLERQWVNQESVRMLQISGFSYSWDGTNALGAKVVSVRVDGAPLERQRVYSLVVNSFMADGGDLFQGGTMGVNHVTRGSDLDALVRFVETQGDGVRAAIDGRITRIR
jgi:5'-nucleotidase